MRVGLLAHSARGDTRIGREIAAKIAFLRDRGADTRLIVANDADFTCRLRANTQRYSRQLPDRLLPWLGKCDLILVEPSETSPVFDLVPKFAGNKPKIVFTDHGDADSRDLAWFADTVVVHNPTEREEFWSDTGYPANRIEQLHSPVDLSWFCPGTAEKPVRAQLNIDANSRLLLIVGELAPKRRGTFVIDALAQLPASVHLVFAGECGGSCESERQRCRERAARHRVADRIHFLGSVDDRDLRNAYRDADLLVLGADSFSKIEAMACGLPVVEARTGADNAAELATEIRRVLNSPAEAGAMRASGLTCAMQFSLAFWRDQFSQLIDRILERPGTLRNTEGRLDSRQELGGPHRRLPVHSRDGRGIQSAFAEDAA